MKKAYEIAELFLKGKNEMSLSPKQHKWLIETIRSEQPKTFSDKSISYVCHNPETSNVYFVTRVSRQLTVSTHEELEKERLASYN